MAQKSYDEKLEEILKKKAQLEAQEKAIKKRKSEDERKNLVELLNQFLEEIPPRKIKSDSLISLKSRK